MTIKLHNKKLTSVFALNGVSENSATYALGWALEKSPVFRDAMIQRLFKTPLDTKNAEISLQKQDKKDGGYTDIEIKAAGRFHIIMEAKRGREIPTEEQLLRYRPRLDKKNQRLLIVSLSAANGNYAKRSGLPSDIENVPVLHLSWDDCLSLAQHAHKQTSKYEEKLWLRELASHLEEYANMNRRSDNLVYVVSLSKKPLHEDKNYTFIDVVDKDRRYIHAVGVNGWPSEPPKYIGFRYDGKLQSVHHIDDFAVAKELSKHNPRWQNEDTDHFIYTLGPPMCPKITKPAGPNVRRNTRVWCQIDTLLSDACETISDAVAETKRRNSED